MDALGPEPLRRFKLSAVKAVLIQGIDPLTTDYHTDHDLALACLQPAPERDKLPT